MFAQYFARGALLFLIVLLGQLLPQVEAVPTRRSQQNAGTGREHISLNSGWKFHRFTSNPDGLIYDDRPDASEPVVLKPWILPSGNDFILDPADRHERPAGNPGSNVTFVQNSFDDSAWENVKLPHDWAIAGPFNTTIPGSEGSLPIDGVGYYRQKLSYTSSDVGKSIYLEVDGAMAYATVWLNGNLVGGWPYPYNSFRLDLTPYLSVGDDNLLAIRLDNPINFSRWYPGAGLYRNVWLTKVGPTQVSQYGTFITTRDVSDESAIVDLAVQVENKGNTTQQVNVVTDVYSLDLVTGEPGKESVAQFPQAAITLSPSQNSSINSTVTIGSPLLWGPLSTQQKPNLYLAITRLFSGNQTDAVDTYETRFGIRSLVYDPNAGLSVNNETVKLQGVNQHHDLGALGAAFNVRAAQRHLEFLQEMGCNAIRMSHNPPAAELLDLADEMGFLILDEIFDVWELEKVVDDFHLIFDDWHEPDLRAFIRRDRNHPSIWAWSFGNEVGEQNNNTAAALIGSMLHGIAHQEDTTRPFTASMNSAEANYTFPTELDILALNYQGDGVRYLNAYSGLNTGERRDPLYDSFHETFPDKLLFESESSATLDTRGTYFFPVTPDVSAPVNDSSGGNSTLEEISAYALYTADFGTSADVVFADLDKHPFVAGEHVWSGWDYLGEASYNARSSYYGIIDLAGFFKDRFYLYQSRWRPDLQMAHILPHWTWPERVGLVTPVHVFSAGDEAELFLNGQSQGRLTKAEFTYRFRWDNVTYQPGVLNVVTYKNGTFWANDTVQTAGDASQLHLTADRASIQADGLDLSFITVKVLDSAGILVPQASNNITFSVSGPGEIVATDNGFPADFTAFPSKSRNAFSGLALAIIRGDGTPGSVTVTATAAGLSSGAVEIQTS